MGIWNQQLVGSSGRKSERDQWLQFAMVLLGSQIVGVARRAAWILRTNAAFVRPWMTIKHFCIISIRRSLGIFIRSIYNCEFI